MNRIARIVLLNGVGSVGKGSIAKALQTMTSEPFLHVQMDAFLEMLPESSFGRPDGLTFETVQEDGRANRRLGSATVVLQQVQAPRTGILRSLFTAIFLDPKQLPPEPPP